MKCPYCGHETDPPVCGNCRAAVKSEKPKVEAPKKAETKPKKKEDK